MRPYGILGDMGRSIHGPRRDRPTSHSTTIPDRLGRPIPTVRRAQTQSPSTAHRCPTTPYGSVMVSRCRMDWAIGEVGGAKC